MAVSSDFLSSNGQSLFSVRHFNLSLSLSHPTQRKIKGGNVRQPYQQVAAA